jgi:hypothetical protein
MSIKIILKIWNTRLSVLFYYIHWLDQNQLLFIPWRYFQWTKSFFLSILPQNHSITRVITLRSLFPVCKYRIEQCRAAPLIMKHGRQKCCYDLLCLTSCNNLVDSHIWGVQHSFVQSWFHQPGTTWRYYPCSWGRIPPLTRTNPLERMIIQR